MSFKDLALPAKPAFTVRTPRFATKCIDELAIRAPGPIYPTRDALGAALNER